MKVSKYEAKPTGFKIYGKYSNIVEYEYRGRKYEVEYPNDMSYYITKPSTQHRIEQEKIDDAIEREKNKKPSEPGESAEVGLDYFFKSLDEE